MKRERKDFLLGQVCRRTSSSCLQVPFHASHELVGIPSRLYFYLIFWSQEARHNECTCFSNPMVSPPETFTRFLLRDSDYTVCWALLLCQARWFTYIVLLNHPTRRIMLLSILYMRRLNPRDGGLAQDSPTLSFAESSGARIEMLELGFWCNLSISS
jgi:hypothetical protein